MFYAVQKNKINTEIIKLILKWTFFLSGLSSVPRRFQPGYYDSHESHPGRARHLTLLSACMVVLRTYTYAAAPPGATVASGTWTWPMVVSSPALSSTKQINKQ